MKKDNCGHTSQQPLFSSVVPGSLLNNRTGTESRETLPLRQTVTMFTLVTAPPEGLSPTVSFHTGTESRKLLPLW